MPFTPLTREDVGRMNQQDLKKLIRANLPNGVTKIQNEPLSKPEAIQYVLAEKIAVDWGIILDFIDDEQGRHTLEQGSVEETMCKIIRSGRAVIPATVSGGQGSSLTPVPQTPPGKNVSKGPTYPQTTESTSETRAGNIDGDRQTSATRSAASASDTPAVIVDGVAIRVELYDPDLRVILLEPVQFESRDRKDGQPVVTSEEVGLVVNNHFDHQNAPGPWRLAWYHPVLKAAKTTIFQVDAEGRIKRAPLTHVPILLPAEAISPCDWIALVAEPFDPKATVTAEVLPRKRRRGVPRISRPERNGIIVKSVTKTCETADPALFDRVMSAKFRSSQSLTSIIEFVLYLDNLRDKNSGPDGKWRCNAPQAPKGGWVVDNEHLAKVFEASAGWIRDCLRAAALIKDQRVRRHHAVISNVYHEVLGDEEQDPDMVDQGAKGAKVKWGAHSLKEELSKVANELGIEADKDSEGGKETDDDDENVE